MIIKKKERKIVEIQYLTLLINFFNKKVTQKERTKKQ
jgi:hypothetical protein